MPVDTSIYNAFLAPPKSALDYQNQYQTAQIQRQNLQQNALQLQQATDVQNQRNAFRSAVQSGGVDLTTPTGQSSAIASFPDVAPAAIKTVQDSLTSSALANKDNAQAANFKSSSAATDFETQTKKYNKAISDITSFSTPSDAIASVLDHVKSGAISADQAKAALTGIPQDPAAFRDWKLQMLVKTMDQKDQVAALTPKVDMVNTGGSIVPTNTNPLAGPVAPVAGAAPIKTTASPDAVLQASTSRANNSATIAAENKRAADALNVEKVKADPFGALGLNANAPATAKAGAGLSGDAYLATLEPGLAAQVKAMADGRLQISPQFTRTPQGSALIQMAMQYEPGTDQTTYASRAATAKDAASGKLAISNNALNTVSEHMAQLADSAAALHNTSFPWVNKVKNFISDATGNPAVRTFGINLQGVSDEMERAYRGAGGSESSIKQWQRNLGDASSPEQFQAVMAQGAEMLQSKLEANQAQYAQGMSGKVGTYSSMTPKAQAALAKLRGQTVAPAAAPAQSQSGLPSADAIAAELARRGH